MRPLNHQELNAVSGGEYRPYGGWLPADLYPPQYGEYDPDSVLISPIDTTPNSPDPEYSSSYDVAISGANLAAAIAAAVATGGVAVPAAAADLYDFLSNAGSYSNTPSQSQINAWNSISGIGIVPTGVYVNYYADGYSSFNIALSSFGSTFSQVSWHRANDSSDTSGPLIEFF